MQWPESVTFHDSSLKKLAVTSDSIIMELEDVFVVERTETVEVVFEGVEQLTEDGSPVDCLRMRMPDAEILTLKEEDGFVNLIMIWTDYERRLSCTTAYRFICRNVKFRIMNNTSVES